MKIKGSRVRTPKITFLVVNARVEKKFCGIKSKSEKGVDSKINSYAD